jgi:hypothetical protein
MTDSDAPLTPHDARKTTEAQRELQEKFDDAAEDPADPEAPAGGQTDRQIAGER